jgi:hypothetical protein
MSARRTHRKKKIQERDLRGWKWLGRFQTLLAAAREKVPAGPREKHGLRELGAHEYLSLFLFGMFNPVVDSMRGLCEASHLRRVREETGAEGPVALSRFSEAQHVFDPELLRQVIGTLVEEGGAQIGASCGGGVDARALRIVESTLWKVVPRMRWAEYGGGRGGKTQAVRLPLKLRVSDGAPAAGLISCGKLCERKALAAQLRPGEIYVGDRYYGADYRLLAAMEKQGCGFLVRLRAAADLRWQSEEPLGDAERAAGLVRAGRATLGSEERGPWRVVRIEPEGKEPVLLVASACFEAMSPGEIAELYRQRWQVEQLLPGAAAPALRAALRAGCLAPLGSAGSNACCPAGTSSPRANAESASRSPSRSSPRYCWPRNSGGGPANGSWNCCASTRWAGPGTKKSNAASRGTCAPRTRLPREKTKPENRRPHVARDCGAPARPQIAPHGATVSPCPRLHSAPPLARQPAPPLLQSVLRTQLVGNLASEQSPIAAEG